MKPELLTKTDAAITTHQENVRARAYERPPLIWARSGILQSAAASIVEGMCKEMVSMVDRIATLGVAMPRT